MNIDIHRRKGNRFIAVPAGHALPESWEGATYFKSIDLKPGQPRIGMVNSTETVLADIEEVGWSVM